MEVIEHEAGSIIMMRQTAIELVGIAMWCEDKARTLENTIDSLSLMAGDAARKREALSTASSLKKQALMIQEIVERERQLVWRLLSTKERKDLLEISGRQVDKLIESLATRRAI